ncbi:hypothetical protein C7410_106125 [Paraburkholderia silvatlantica]|uniref:Uncharacterized protein n=1 Tax=Paraburkholderia silvatlantica TaxID=321895 RepID=A0A2V4TFI1_9BURK|nr:hypothetical protein C7410_106125 [Paraburkholderia silvatlantica]TDQ97489.1 hypothetical protein C7412_108125 [Paraburkholderia silvatlantica]
MVAQYTDDIVIRIARRGGVMCPTDVSEHAGSRAPGQTQSAKKQGFIGPARTDGGAHRAQLEIANACRRRCLVVLHLELNPPLAQGM